MNKLLSHAAVLWALLGLAGCFDIDQTFVVRPDQTAEFNVVFSIDSSLIELSGRAQVDLEQACNSKDAFEQAELPGRLKRVNNVRIVDNTLHCEYTIMGPLGDFEQLSSSVGEELGEVDLLSFERLDDSRARIVAEYNFSGDGPGTSQAEGMEQSVRRMIASNFEGHAIQWSIKAPTILDSNGVIAADGRSVTWAVPLEEAIATAGRYRFEAVIDVKQYQPRFF